MKATDKMRGFGLKRLEQETGRSLSILYRWIKALEAGRGIRDANKRKLIEITRDTPHAITWSDFEPELEQAA